MSVEHTARQRLGKAGEQMVARRLRELGFDVVLSPKSRGVFDVTATRGGCVVLVQCKNFTSRANANRRPFVLHKKLMSAPAPDGAIRIWWSRCANTRQEFVWRITPTAFEPWSFQSLAI
jgi:hypothetical protein